MKLAGVEAARGLAAMLVVFVHASSILADPRDFGVMPFAGLFAFAHAGVDFFFVLSGFIILFTHRQDIGRPDALAAYGWKRFARLVPTYWIVLCLYGLVLAVSPTAARHEREPLTVLANALLIPQPDHPMIIGVAWSLQHEVLFYALFGLLLLHRRLGLGVLGLWGGLCAVNLATGRLNAFPGDLLFRGFNIEFFFGMTLAWALRRFGPPSRPAGMVVAGLALFFGAGLLESWGPGFPAEWPPLHAAYATGAALGLYGLVGAEMTGRLTRLPGWAMTLGTASYPIYLLHVLVIMLVQHGLRLLAPTLTLTVELAFIVAVTATVLAACAFSRLVEQPLLRRCRQLVPPRHAVTATVAVRGR